MNDSKPLRARARARATSLGGEFDGRTFFHGRIFAPGSAQCVGRALVLGMHRDGQYDQHLLIVR